MSRNRPGIGIDFGTSNSAVATYDGERVRFIPVENEQRHFPTAVHINRELEITTGSAAIAQYVDENRARRVEITARRVAEAAFDVREALEKSPLDEEDSRNAIYGAAEDHGLPGRLFLGLKRLLGQADIKRVPVFGHPFRLVALVTPVFLSIRSALAGAGLTESESGLADAVHLGRPVEFEGPEGSRNQTATQRLRESARHAGFNSIQFYPEPVAACLSFVHRKDITEQSLILTVDFGGGTLDLSLVRYSRQDFEVVDTAGAPVGGDHIDQQIFRSLIFPELGKGITWTREVEGKTVTTPFPFSLYENALLNWTITHTLHQNDYLTPPLEYISRGGPHTRKLERLRDVIQHNYSYNILQAIRLAKARLSESENTVIDIPELDLSLPFSREQLESLLDSPLATLSDRINVLLGRNGITEPQIDYVVRTGGSCQLRAVIAMLEKQFPGRVVDHDPFTGVASGLAIASYLSASADLEL